MQCPICASEISPDAVVCEKCGAAKVTRRSPAGVLVGWLGMTMTILWGMLWLFLLALLGLGNDVSGFPWLVLILGTVVAAGLLWYSRSTIHTQWLSREN